MLSGVREGAKSTCPRTPVGWALGKDGKVHGLMDSSHVWMLGNENSALHRHARAEPSQPAAALLCEGPPHPCRCLKGPSPQLTPGSICPLVPYLSPSPRSRFHARAEIHPNTRGVHRPWGLCRISGIRAKPFMEGSTADFSINSGGRCQQRRDMSALVGNIWDQAWLQLLGLPAARSCSEDMRRNARALMPHVPIASHPSPISTALVNTHKPPRPVGCPQKQRITSLFMSGTGCPSLPHGLRVPHTMG